MIRIDKARNGLKKPCILKNKKFIFYSLMMAFPLLQFCIFYIGVNANSIIMSFQNITYTDAASAIGNNAATTYTWTLQKYKDVLRFLFGKEGLSLLSVSLKYYAVSLIGVPLGLLFAYYIYKRRFGWRTFRILLFLPSILSGVVMAVIFRYLVDKGIPLIFTAKYGGSSPLAATSPSSFWYIIFFNLWISFGTSVLMFSNKMSSISTEVIESARLDGANDFREFIHIALPNTYSILSVFLVTGIAQICMNQYHLFDMFSGNLPNSELRNFGYMLFFEVAGKFSVGGSPQLPYYAAMGVVITLIVVPITFIVRALLEKFGPSED